MFARMSETFDYSQIHLKIDELFPILLVLHINISIVIVAGSHTTEWTSTHLHNRQNC